MDRARPDDRADAARAVGIAAGVGRCARPRDQPAALCGDRSRTPDALGLCHRRDALAAAGEPDRDAALSRAGRAGHRRRRTGGHGAAPRRAAVAHRCLARSRDRARARRRVERVRLAARRSQAARLAAGAGRRPGDRRLAGRRDGAVVRERAMAVVAGDRTLRAGLALATRRPSARHQPPPSRRLLDRAAGGDA